MWKHNLHKPAILGCIKSIEVTRTALNKLAFGIKKKQKKQFALNRLCKERALPEWPDRSDGPKETMRTPFGFC